MLVENLVLHEELSVPEAPFLTSAVVTPAALGVFMGVGELMS